jgi:predicted ATPase
LEALRGIDWLCDAAAGGQILLSGLVRELVGSRGEFRFRALGALSLKGLREPVAACELLWEPVTDAAAALSAAVASAGKRDSFVGRARELSLLRESFDRARVGELELVLVAGEPGVGKTRLAFELARYAHEQGATVLYGRCDEEALVAYQPFVQGLSEYVARCPVDRLRTLVGAGAPELGRLLPELGRRLPGFSEPTAAEPEAERYRLFEAASDFVGELAAQAPVLLLLDDLHRAEKPTLLLLRHLVSPASRSPVTVLGTYRDSELSRTRPLAETLADLRRERRAERIALKGLDEREAVQLIGALAGGASR